MPQLFENTWINSLELANRAVRSATWSGLGDDQGYVTDRALEFYRELGRGGIGLIVTGFQYVMTNGRPIPYMIGNCSDDHVEGLRRLAEAVHSEGGRIVAQIVHGGSRADQAFFADGDELWGPSAIPFSAKDKVPREMTRQQITRVIEAYTAAALRSQQAGFDGVQLHGAHGYRINQFLSAAWNRRGDKYGGSVKNRYRFLGEVMEAVRGAVGSDFPVLIKLSGHDFLEGGLVPDESVEIARRLVDDGIDAIEVSGGSTASPEGMSPSRKPIAKEEKAYFADLAALIKKATGVPVITVGGVRSFKKVQTILSEHKADYVAMSRPFVREPHLINRWKSGDTSRAKCISCSGCFESGRKGLGISCKVEREQSAKKR